MDILKAEDLAWYANRQTAGDTQVLVIAVHVLVGGRGRRLSEINRLVVALGVADERKAAAANARVVHANDADAERGADNGVDSVAL